jgi:hypothetical protein
MKTGWSEEAILAMPVERRNTYIRDLNALYSKSPDFDRKEW